MFELKAAFRFIIKSPFQTLTVLLAVIIGIGVEFFILSLGDVLDEMVLEQTTSYQDHIYLDNYLAQPLYYDMLDFDLIDQLQNEKKVKYAFYAHTIQGAITEINGEVSTPILLNFISFDNHNNDDAYLNYTGLDVKRNLSDNSKIPTNDNEIMLDKFFADKNEIKINDEITYKANIDNNLYTFKVVGLFDLGVFRKDNAFTYTNTEKFGNFESSKFTLKVQLHNPINTDDGIEIIKKYYDNPNFKFKTWKEVTPEFNVLNLAQNATIFMIEIFISIAFFVVVLSVFNFSIKQKYKQIGILKAIGEKNKKVGLIFFYQTTIITLIGIIIGLIGGFIAIKLYANYMTYPDGEPRFLVNFKFTTFFIPLILIFTSSLFATFVSVIKVRRLEIIDLIKI